MRKCPRQLSKSKRSNLASSEKWMRKRRGRLLLKPRRYPDDPSDEGYDTHLMFLGSCHRSMTSLPPLGTGGFPIILIVHHVHPRTISRSNLAAPLHKLEEALRGHACLGRCLRNLSRQGGRLSRELNPASRDGFHHWLCSLLSDCRALVRDATRRSTTVPRFWKCFSMRFIPIRIKMYDQASMLLAQEILT